MVSKWERLSFFLGSVLSCFCFFAFVSCTRKNQRRRKQGLERKQELNVQKGRRRRRKEKLQLFFHILIVASHSHLLTELFCLHIESSPVALALDDHHAAVPLSPPGKHDRIPDPEVVGLAQCGPPGAESGVPLARRAQGLVRYQPLAVLLVEHAHPAAEDDGVGLAAGGRAARRGGFPRFLVVSGRRPAAAAGVAAIVREQVCGHDRVDVHAVEVGRARQDPV